MGASGEKELNLRVNRLPSITWNKLQINDAEVRQTIDLNGRGECIIHNIPAGVIIGSENCDSCSLGEDKRPFLPVRAGLPKEKEGNSDPAGKSDTASVEGRKVLDTNSVILRTGMGEAAEKFFDENCNEALSIRAICGAGGDKPLKLNYKLGDGDGYVVRQKLIAEEGSTLTVIMDYSADKENTGFFGVQTLAFAKKNSTINIIKIQLLGQGFTHFEDIGGFAQENAKINVIQMILGSGKSYVGMNVELAGYKSAFEGNVGYLCLGDQKLDMNYYIGHSGRRSTSSLRVEGALSDNGAKVFRGTIDLKHGAKGAKGQEQEGTLLLSENVRNKTLPVILCDEDDVEGEHGATIGRLSADMLFYMQTRGISEKEAELLMTKAKLNTVRNLIKDEHSIGKIQHYMESVF
ncbi:MAG: SufD family Fe-S cluster assembly protein [Lachnospiraceae bacterium]|nr:SufD family Fe-S cluster assembly protein [Lachnospiraceae bacterium]